MEFALIGLPFLMLLLGGMEFARYAYTVQAVRSYAAQAARAALVYVGNDTANRCVGTLPLSLTPSPGLDEARLTPAKAGCVRDSKTGVLTITVSTSYRFSMVTGLLGAGDRTVSETQSRAL
ncbi:TadE family protein [Roseomonas elaeocarpi]|uniref:TadE family protein n=1 Tax=Roseomonas elaeocarpi TaxID=907779 RepID=A0ABV6JS53_9PROT